MSSNAALEQRKIPSRDRRQQKRSGGAVDKAKKTVSKALANSAANSAAKPFTSHLSTPPPRSQHRGGQDASHLLNFRAPERRHDLGSRPLPHRRRGPVVHFDKDRYFGANYRFVVAREQGEDYAAHLAFADKAVDWPLIREVHVSEEGSYNCPICLEPPIAARLTQNFGQCPICTNIVTSSRDMLKPAVVHVNDPVKVNNCVSLELMRRERGATVAVRCTSLAESEVARVNGEIGLPKCAASGFVCPLDVGHRDAKFVKVLSVKDPKLISEREHAELMEVLKLSHSSGDLEMVPHIESCLRDLEMHDAAAAAELADKSASTVAVVGDGANPQDRADPQSAPMPASPAAAAGSSPAGACVLSATAAVWSPGAPCSPSVAAGRGGRGCGDSPSYALNRSGSFNQKVWVDGEMLDSSAFDEPEDSDEDDYADADPAHDDDEEFDEQQDLGSESSSVAGSFAGDQVQEEEMQVVAEMAEANRRAREFAVDGIHFFYQASDGQKVFLHPVSMRCLLEEHGSYLNLPRAIKAKVLDLEICVQTEELRKRHRALEHVPLSADIRFVEVDVVPLLSKDTLEKMRNKLEERTKLRRQRAKREAQQIARAEHKERRQREKQNPPPPADLLHGPSLMVSMIAAQARLDEDTMQALLLSDGLSPPLPSLLSAGAPEVGDLSGQSPSSAGVSPAAGPRWTQMVQEGRASSARQREVDNSNYFPSLGAEAFPSLGGPTGLREAKDASSIPSCLSPAAASGWGKAASPPAAAGGGWGARAAGGAAARTPGVVVAGKLAPKVGLNVKWGSEGGAREAGMFEIDDLLDSEISEDERQRRREEAAAKAWEQALAASTGAAGGEEQPQAAGGKCKKGRRKGQVVLAWG